MKLYNFWTRMKSLMIHSLASAVLLTANLSSADEHWYSARLPNFFQWNTTDLLILVVPESHGPLVTDDMTLLSDDITESAPGGEYLRATLDTIENWKYAVKKFANENPEYAWIAEIKLRVRIVGFDQLTQEDFDSAHIILTNAESMGVIGGIAGMRTQSVEGFGSILISDFETNQPHKCMAITNMSGFNGFFLNSFNYQDMYNLAGHELGHCLGLDHSQNQRDDVMIAYYQHPVGQSSTPLLCRSNLNVLGFASAFENAAGIGPGGWEARVLNREYKQYCETDM